MVGLLLIVFMFSLTVLSQADPCNNFTMLYDDGGRSIKCDRHYYQSSDRFILEGWRRVQLQPTGEDLTMPTRCVPHGYCGSHSNVWLDGNHPRVEDDIVDRMGCLSMFSSCCKLQYLIQIKNCTDYMVYNLMRTFGSDERYCFGDSTLCYEEPRPTTESWANQKNDSGTTVTIHTNSSQENNHSLASDYEKDEVITILGVFLTITTALLFTFGILYYFRQRKTGIQCEHDTNSTMA